MQKKDHFWSCKNYSPTGTEFTKAAIGAPAAKVRFVRDSIVEPTRSERVVWDCLTLRHQMAALVKFAALPINHRCTCERMLRQRRRKIQGRFCPHCVSSCIVQRKSEIPQVHLLFLIAPRYASSGQLGRVYMGHLSVRINIRLLCCIKCYQKSGIKP